MFTLTNISLSLPYNKPACLLLARDMTEILFSLTGNGQLDQESNLFNCSGCHGLVKFKHTTDKGGYNSHNIRLQTVFSGQLDELPPEELLQTINMNQKSGTLVMETSGSSATLAFKDGQLMKARYKEKERGSIYEDKEAFYLLLKEKEGDFHFSRLLPPSLDQATPIGDFMNLLMEGLQKIDEG